MSVPLIKLNRGVPPYEQLKDSYIPTREMVERIRPDLTNLHPLPRVNEISTDVDTLSGAACFCKA